MARDLPLPKWRPFQGHFRAGVLRAPALAAIILLALIPVIYLVAVRPNYVPRRFGVVEPGKLYRAGHFLPGALAHVKETTGIRTIIDFGAHEPGSPDEAREARSAAALGIDRFVLRLEGDGTGNLNNYARALEIMNDPARQPVLVHCSAGTQRTGCAVALYKKMNRGASIDELLADSAKYGHDPKQNPHVREILETRGDQIIDAARHAGNIDGFAPVPPPVRSGP